MFKKCFRCVRRFLLSCKLTCDPGQWRSARYFLIPSSEFILEERCSAVAMRWDNGTKVVDEGELSLAKAVYKHYSYT